VAAVEYVCLVDVDVSSFDANQYKVDLAAYLKVDAQQIQIVVTSGSTRVTATIKETQSLDTSSILQLLQPLTNNTDFATSIFRVQVTSSVATQVDIIVSASQGLTGSSSGDDSTVLVIVICGVAALVVALAAICFRRKMGRVATKYRSRKKFGSVTVSEGLVQMASATTSTSSVMVHSMSSDEKLDAADVKLFADGRV